MTEKETELKSQRVAARLCRLPEYGRSRCIMLYWSCHNEVQTHELVQRALREGKRVALPRCNVERGEIYPYEVKDISCDLETGPFGIAQPKEDAGGLVELSEIEICVVPGIAFDREGNRVGRGLGFYDRFLHRLDKNTERIGVAYAFQIVDKIYPTDEDASVNKVVTENETLVASRSVIK